VSSKAQFVDCFIFVFQREFWRFLAKKPRVVLSFNDL
jgi:hypothetical protein